MRHAVPRIGVDGALRDIRPARHAAHGIPLAINIHTYDALENVIRRVSVRSCGSCNRSRRRFRRVMVVRHKR